MLTKGFVPKKINNGNVKIKRDNVSNLVNLNKLITNHNTLSPFIHKYERHVIIKNSNM